MHEFGVTQAALETALSSAAGSDAVEISDVYLTIGAITSIDPESIRLYWGEIAEGTIAENARLHFRPVPSDCFCADCGQTFVVDAELVPCPGCGSEKVRAVDEEFLALGAIDIESHPSGT